MTNQEPESEIEEYSGYSTVPLDDSNEDDDNFISPLFFPSNIFYKFLSIDYFLAKKRIAPTPMMVQIFKDVEILDPQEAFNMKNEESEKE
jgi:hypothetical protein